MGVEKWCYCSNCGKKLMDTSINGMCWSCYQNSVQKPVIEQQFNYECPDCHGKFNHPAIVNPASTTTICYYKCPFCNRKMEGL